MRTEKISVVVCVKNEEARLEECLKKIKLNEPDELIVVDGDSTDKTAEIARQYADKVIISKNSNLTRDRQIGLNAARNEYIAMIDGDHRLEKGDLDSLLKDLLDNQFSVVQSQLKSYNNRGWWNKGEEQMWDLNDNIPGPSKMVGAAPTIYRKSLFEKIQFDDTITKTIDDTDFAYRLSLIPDIKYGIGKTKIAQFHMADKEDYLRKFKWYGIGDGEFCIKHRNRALHMWFHLLIEYPIIYPVRAILTKRYYAAAYCFIQGVIRAKWMIKTIFKHKTSKLQKNKYNRAENRKGNRAFRNISDNKCTVWENKMYRTICKCRICGNPNLVSIVDLGGGVKLTGIFPKPSQSVEGGPLELVKCMPPNAIDGSNGSVCGLVQLKHSYDSNQMYGENYGYRSGLNQSMVEHLTDITTEIKSQVELCENDLIIDIGSNDGTLLKSYGIKGLDYVGVDPTGIKFKKYYSDNIQLVPDFFSAERITEVRNGKKAKVVTSIAMFYDLEEPIKFAQDINDVLAEDGVWVMEQSYLPAMLEANSYDTICHEHLEFYCLSQIEWIIKAVGLKIIRVCLNDVNGGSFRIMIAKQHSTYKEDASVEELRRYELENKFDTLLPYVRFKQNIEKSRKEVMQFIRQARGEGKKIYGYGASTKGNVLLQYCGITAEDIIAIAEVNEDKYGCITPGSNIPIISEEEAKREEPDYFIVLPWHFRDHILMKEKEYIANTKCKFVFPLPKLEIVDSGNYERQAR